VRGFRQFLQKEVRVYRQPRVRRRSSRRHENGHVLVGQYYEGGGLSAGALLARPSAVGLITADSAICSVLPGCERGEGVRAKGGQGAQQQRPRLRQAAAGGETVTEVAGATGRREAAFRLIAIA